MAEQNGDYVFTPHSNLWRPDPQFPASGKFVFDKFEHQGMKKDECHYIEFKLHETHNAGLSFPTVKEEAMWVIRPTPGHDCPDASDVSAGNIDYSVMGPHKRDSSTQLTAYNRNMDPEQWSFSLNFVKPGGQDGDISNYACWDPVGDNQDGGTTLTSRSLLTYAGVALGAGLVSAVVTTAAVWGLRLI